MTFLINTPDRRGRFNIRNSLRILALASLLGSAPLGAAAAPVAPAVAAFTWHIETVDAHGTVGQFTSLALQPATGKPHISYYDDTNGDLKLALPVPAGSGDCGPQNGWSCNSIAFQNTVDYGLQSSIDFPATGTWSIAYANTTLGSNAFRGIPAPLADEEFWEPIEAPGNIAVANTMRFDQNGVSHVSYGFVDTNAGKAYIKHAMYHGLGGNCGGGLWQCSIVVETSGQGLTMYNTLTLMRNLPFVFYADINRHLALAINAAVNCGEPLDWNCTTIDTASTVNGMMSAVVSPTQASLGVGYLGVAYIGDTDLRYARLVSGSAANCGNADLPMKCDVIDAVGAASNSQLMSASMALLNGQPVIAYTAHFRGATLLKVAYPQANGNCGPTTPGGQHTWRCDIVDGGTHDVGYYPSLKIDSSGRIHIAYFDFTAGDLKYAVSELPPPPPTPTPVPGKHPAYLPVVLRQTPAN